MFYNLIGISLMAGVVIGVTEGVRKKGKSGRLLE